MSSETISINVGPLTGIGSLCRHTARHLKRFSDLYMQGTAPDVEWDLRFVEPGRMSIAGLTAFLSLAHRMRRFTGRAQGVQVRWNPHVFAFWSDISLFAIAREFDLVDWPAEMIGGFHPGATNPHTQILIFPFTDAPFTSSVGAPNEWKDDVRQWVKRDLLLRCGPLFQPFGTAGGFSSKITDQVAITSAELVVNALLHGREAAFVGLQRSPRGITVAVCDSGVGFLRSLQEKAVSRIKAESHVDAILTGSLVNTGEMGLRRGIDAVMQMDGWVVVSSYDAEIRWKPSSWSKALRRGGEGSTLGALRLTDIFTPDTPGNSSSEGYYRKFEHGLRGSRIAFEISNSRT